MSDSRSSKLAERQARVEAALLAALSGEALALAAVRGGVRSELGRELPAWRDPDGDLEQAVGTTGSYAQWMIAAARAFVTARDRCPPDEVAPRAVAIWTSTELPLWTLHHAWADPVERVLAEALAAGGDGLGASSAPTGRAPPVASEADCLLYLSHARPLVTAPALAVAVFHAPSGLSAPVPAAGASGPALVVRDALAMAQATHGHPHGLLAASGFAVACWMALEDPGARGRDLVARLAAARADWGLSPWQQPGEGGRLRWAERAAGLSLEGAWSRAAEAMSRVLDRVLVGIARGEGVEPLDAAILALEQRPTAIRALAMALHRVARATEEPSRRGPRVLAVTGLPERCPEAGEAAAVAAMTGTLLGLLSGPGWLPAAWARVQDGTLALELAEDLTRGATRYGPEPVTRAALEALREAIRGGAETLVLDGTRVVNLGQPPTVVSAPCASGNGEALRYRGLTSDGQRFDVTLPLDA